MKYHAPHWWRPGDERQYQFSRSSGLPIGYFNNRWRPSWRVVIVLIVAALICCSHP